MKPALKRSAARQRGPSASTKHESDALVKASAALRSGPDGKINRRNLLIVLMEANKLKNKYAAKSGVETDRFLRMAAEAKAAFEREHVRLAEKTLAALDFDAAYWHYDAAFNIDRHCKEQFEAFQWIEYRRLLGCPVDWLREWLEYRCGMMPKCLRAKRAQERTKKKATGIVRIGQDE